MLRVARSLSVLAVLVPGLLAVPVLTPAASAAPVPVPPVVQELSVEGVDEAAAQQSAPSGVTGALVLGAGRRTVLLTDLLDTRTFGLVGVTWDHSPAVGTVQAWVRTRTDGSWSGWQDLGGLADEQPDRVSPDTGAALRGGTSPLWVGSADGIQARVDVLSGPDPKGLRLSLVDPGESPADGIAGTTGALSTAGAASRAPVVRTRADWGADESLRRASPSYAGSVRAVTIHHTASANDYSAEDVPRLLRGFYAYHVKSQGWSDIGYNFLVDRFGTVWEGRAGGTSRAVIGSHAGGFNTGTIGISMIGTYEAVAPSKEMLESVSQLVAWRLSQAGVDPRGSLTMTSGGSTKFTAGTPVSLPTVFAHRQVSSTSCPGTRGFAAMPAIRERAAALAGGAPAAEAGPRSLEVSAPATVAAGTSVAVDVTGGTPGAAVEVWFNKKGDVGFTKRRDGVLSATGTYRTTYVAEADHAFFAIVGGVASPRRTTRVTTAPAATAGTPSALRIQGPVTAKAGSDVLLTATGPAGLPVTVWFRRQGEPTFVQRRAGVLDANGTYTTRYTADLPHEYFVKSATVTSADATTLVGEVPNGLDVTAPAGVEPGRTVEVIVQGTPGQQVEVWFARRGESAYTRRREAQLAPDGTFRTTFVANDEYSYFAVSGDRTSKRVRTRVTKLPALVAAPAPRLVVTAPPKVEAGSTVEVAVAGPAGAPVQLWFRRRGAETWSRLREGRFDPAGRWSTVYAGVDDHEYWASSGGSTSPDGATLTMPVVAGPASAALGTKVQLVGRARPGDSVVVESRRRGASAFARTTLTADGSGTFRTSYAADDEYEYRPLAATRVGALRRTTVAPTVAGAAAVRRGTPVTVAGTARPGAKVEVLFRRDGQPSLTVGGRRARDLPTFRVGRTVTAGTDGRWSTSFAPTAPHSWYVRSDGNASAVRRTSVR
ncbi:MAG: repeat protein [Frankiales bacterium]|nr:repeat protein [Frankiales bacterium]